jgi:hypothetical protein
MPKCHVITIDRSGRIIIIQQKSASRLYIFLYSGSERHLQQKPTAPIIALMMEVARTSETSVNVYQITQRNNPEGNHLHTRPAVRT